MDSPYGIKGTIEGPWFKRYLIYGWGFPCFFTIFTFMADTFDVLPQNMKPNIGQSSCWFSNIKPFLDSLQLYLTSFISPEIASTGHKLFFLLPIGIQISLNVVLFAVTAFRINRVRSKMHRNQLGESSDQKKSCYIINKAM